MTDPRLFQNAAFVHYSGFTEEHLRTGHLMLLQTLIELNFRGSTVCRKYANKKFLKASVFAVEWANTNFADECKLAELALEE